jgi:hypothetical protein
MIRGVLGDTGQTNKVGLDALHLVLGKILKIDQAVSRTLRNTNELVQLDL